MTRPTRRHLTAPSGAPMILNADGQTYRYKGRMQWPMTPLQQRKAGLIATTSTSIHGRPARRTGTA